MPTNKAKPSEIHGLVKSLVPVYVPPIPERRSRDWYVEGLLKQAEVLNAPVEAWARQIQLLRDNEYEAEALTLEAAGLGKAGLAHAGEVRKLLHLAAGLEGFVREGPIVADGTTILVQNPETLTREELQWVLENHPTAKDRIAAAKAKKRNAVSDIDLPSMAEHSAEVERKDAKARVNPLHHDNGRGRGNTKAKANGGNGSNGSGGEPGSGGESSATWRRRIDKDALL